MPVSLFHYLELIGYFFLLFCVVPIKYRSGDDTETQFLQYIKDFNKSYSEKEYLHRFKAFEHSINMIQEYNSNRTDTSARFGLTKFSDMPPEEFSHHLMGLTYKRNKPFRITSKLGASRITKRQVDVEIPKKIDWRTRNAVGKVRNQQGCGACWAYSAVETIESIKAIQSGLDLEELSVQQMVDCSKYNRGCLGGDVCLLVQWLVDYNVTIHKEKEYPLSNKVEECNDLKNLPTTEGVRVLDFSCNNLVGSESIILEYLAKFGPVAVAINAYSWQNYIGGVIQYHCSGAIDDLNHAVQIVGYNLEAETPYYIARNTWGQDFGDEGYVYIAIGNNLCGLANEVTMIEVL